MKKYISRAHVLPWALFFVKLIAYYYMMELPMNWWWLPAITFGGFFLFFEATLWTDKRWMHILFSVGYSFIAFVMAADTMYYDYFGQFISINQLWQLESLFAAGTETNLMGALAFPWGILFFLDIPFMCKWHKERTAKRITWTYLIPTAGFLAYCCVLGVIGANVYLNGDFMRMNHLEFVSCHVNDIYTAVKGRMSKNEVDPEEIKKIIADYVPKAEKEELKGVAEGKNLILIQVESLNTWPIGMEIMGQEITPNLNRLIQNDTLYFSNVFSSSGKGNTSDAEFATLNSLYPTTVRECYRMYVNNTYNGLPWILRSLGYETMAFHGYEKEFWNRNIAYKNQGIQTFYSQSELEMTEKSGFGLTDKEMFRQAVDILKEKEEPWFSFMITLTNHIPYELEESLVSFEVPLYLEGSLVGNYMRAVRYTDEAIAMLIEYLKEANLYENTVIALYGDHQGLTKETESVAKKMTHVLGREYDYDEMMRVPFMVHVPGLNEYREIDTVGGQVDILPTLANLMNLPVKQDYIFGSDLLNIAREDGFYAPVTYMPVGSFAINDIIFELGRDGSYGSGHATRLHTGEEVSVDGLEEYMDRAMLLIETSKKVLDANLMKDEIRH